MGNWDFGKKNLVKCQYFFVTFSFRGNFFRGLKILKWQIDYFTILSFTFRYFILDNGLLSYGKSATEVKRGRTHGVIDVGTSVISAKTELFRIDIDDENFIHHLKVVNFPESL